MIKRFATVAVAAAGICLAMPASAEQVGVGIGVGPAGAGVTVGTSHDRVVREREVIRERAPRDETVIIRRDRDRDRDGKTVIIDNDRR